jgi:glutamate-5-semialdehyde dehydrogenase
MKYLNELGENAQKAARTLARMSAPDKNKLLESFADALLANEETILRENERDMMLARGSRVKPALLDRLALDGGRLRGMADGMRAVAAEADPVGEVLSMKKMPNGLLIGQKRVPLGVVGIICESRPNVTSDAAALCVKSGNAVILRGGSDAINSNKAIVGAFRKVLAESGLPEGIVQLVEDTSRETAQAFMKLNQYVDVLIPRGGAELIKTAVENATIPVIETGTGNCHIFADESADLDKAVEIIVNAKVQRPGVCNACEKLLVHKNIAERLLPALCAELAKHNVVIRGDAATLELVPNAEPADESDWPKEYLDFIIGIKVVEDINEALEHIARFSTRHSEAILTESYANAQCFLDEVDSAAVYVNASTRFTDGGEFGLGAEMGVSTQKLHARGPMGLKELTSTKFIIYGNGQVRG